MPTPDSRTFLVTCTGTEATDDPNLVAEDIQEILISEGLSVSSVKPWSPHNADTSAYAPSILPEPSSSNPFP